MSDCNDKVKLISKRLRINGFSQVEGYNKFQYIRETENAVTLLREKGTETRIPFNKLVIALEAMKKEPEIYDAGPASLRKYGITHINSPIWSLVHLLSKEELLS